MRGAVAAIDGHDARDENVDDSVGGSDDFDRPAQPRDRNVIDGKKPHDARNRTLHRTVA